jgi:hypothetical protein
MTNKGVFNTLKVFWFCCLSHTVLLLLYIVLHTVMNSSASENTSQICGFVTKSIVLADILQCSNNIWKRTIFFTFGNPRLNTRLFHPNPYHPQWIRVFCNTHMNEQIVFTILYKSNSLRKQPVLYIFVSCTCVVKQLTLGHLVVYANEIPTNLNGNVRLDCQKTLPFVYSVFFLNYNSECLTTLILGLAFGQPGSRRATVNAVSQPARWYNCTQLEPLKK